MHNIEIEMGFRETPPKYKQKIQWEVENIWGVVHKGEHVLLLSLLDTWIRQGWQLVGSSHCVEAKNPWSDFLNFIKSSSPSSRFYFYFWINAFSDEIRRQKERERGLWLMAIVNVWRRERKTVERFFTLGFTRSTHDLVIQSLGLAEKSWVLYGRLCMYGRREERKRKWHWYVCPGTFSSSFHTDPPLAELRLGSALLQNGIKEGDDVYFECHLKSNPPVQKLTWMLNVSFFVIACYYRKSISHKGDYGHAHSVLDPGDRYKCFQRPAAADQAGDGSKLSFPSCRSLQATGLRHHLRDVKYKFRPLSIRGRNTWDIHLQV